MKTNILFTTKTQVTNDHKQHKTTLKHIYDNKNLKKTIKLHVKS